MLTVRQLEVCPRGMVSCEDGITWRLQWKNKFTCLWKQPDVVAGQSI